MNKGGDKRAAAAANGRTVGRPRKQPAAVKEGRALSAEVASAVLGSIDEKEYWRQLLRTDQPIKLLHTLPLSERIAIKSVLEYVTNRDRGKPAEKIEGSFDPDRPFVLTIEHIGRNPRKAATSSAQAK